MMVENQQQRCYTSRESYINREHNQTQKDIY